MLKKFAICYLFLVLSLLGSKSWAVDLVVDDEPNEQLARGYVLQDRDVIGGYPIFLADGEWTLASTRILSSTGPQRSIPTPQVWLNRVQSGNWVMGQRVTVTLHLDGSSEGWGGDPCSGEKIVKINHIRGLLDRCATAELVNLKIDGTSTDVLKLTFTETNNWGRFYSTDIYANFGIFGLSHATVASKDSDFNKQLAEWMRTMLAAVVNAAGTKKPKDAYALVPPLSSVLMPRKNLSSGS